MKFLLSFRKAILLLIGAVALPQAPAADVTLIEWGDNAAGRESLQLEPSERVVKPGFFTFAYDDSHSWKPQSLLNGDAPGDFGMAVTSSVGASPAEPHVMRLDSIQGRLRAQVLVNGSPNLPPGLRGIFFLTKAHFSHPVPGKVKFSPGSRMFFRGILDGVAPVARWLVRDGDEWFISEATLTAQAVYNVAEDRELPDPQSTRWARYTPEISPLERASDVFETHTFEDITGAGVFWDSYDSETLIGGTSFTRFAVESFVLEASE